VPGSDITLKVAAIRGVESRGMMCSVRELELGDEHDGIIELPDDAPSGAAFATMRAARRSVIDVASRQTVRTRWACTALRAISRGRLGALKPIEVEEIAGAFPCPDRDPTDDPEGCPAFYGASFGREERPSPAWLQQRLKAVGQRPISALVDMTITSCSAIGRPLHVYDLHSCGGALVARRARDGEELLALNGKIVPARSEHDGDRRRCPFTISAASWAASSRACRRARP
jgi:phenylalanyl-tRNA synthetase beta chain